MSEPRVVFLVPALSELVLAGGPSLDPESEDILSELADKAGVDAQVVFVSTHEAHAGKPDKIRIGRVTKNKPADPESIRGQRNRVMQEIEEFDPDWILCFGATAVSCATNKGNDSVANNQRTNMRFEGLDIPAIATHSLEYTKAKHGLRKWLLMDLQAAMNGHVETAWGDYEVLSPNTPEWSSCPAPLHGLDSGAFLGFDLETYPGLDPWHPDARIRMAVVSDKPGRAWVVQLPPDSTIPAWLDELLRRPDLVKCGSNIKFDFKWMQRFGYDVVNMWDTSTAEHIIDETDPLKDLKSLTFRYLPRLADYSKGHRALVAARGGWEHVADDEQYDYAGADGEASIAAAQGQKVIIDGAGLGKAHALMRGLYPVLGSMEARGACVSRETNGELDQRFQEELASVRAAICDQLGPINPASPKQLVDALHENVPDINLVLKKHHTSRLFAGKYYKLPDDDDESFSTQKAILERESHKHPVIEDILMFRRLSKLHGTYVTGLAEKHMVDHPDGLTYVHTSYRSDVVETNRLSSQAPNNQNIPKKPDAEDDHAIPLELNIKRQYISRFAGGSIIEGDLGQAEVRVAAWLSQDQKMIDAIASGEDLHYRMASIVYDKPVDKVTPLERQHIKRTTFLLMYGGGSRTLAAQLGISKDAAQALIDGYFATFSGLDNYIKRIHSRVQRDHFVETPFGFRRRFIAPDDWDTWPGWRIQRQAWNMCVQNPAACITYAAMIGLEEAMRRAALQSQLVLQVHDSVIVDTYPGEEEAVCALVRNNMTNPDLERWGVTGFDMPLVSDVEIGKNWGDMQLVA